MKRILWLIACVAAVWGLPRLSHPAVDVGKLDPVETVLLTVTETGVKVETDTGARGSGQTLDAAWKELQHRAEKEIFPDTTSNLLISGDPAACWEQIYGMFRPSCRVCRAEGVLDLERVTQYLSVHRPELTLKSLRAGENNWQVLTKKEGGYLIEPE